MIEGPEKKQRDPVLDIVAPILGIVFGLWALFLVLHNCASCAGG